MSNLSDITDKLKKKMSNDPEKEVIIKKKSDSQKKREAAQEQDPDDMDAKPMEKNHMDPLDTKEKPFESAYEWYLESLSTSEKEVFEEDVEKGAAAFLNYITSLTPQQIEGLIH